MTHINNRNKDKSIYQAIVSKDTTMLELKEVTSKKLKRVLNSLFNKNGNK